MKTNPKAILAVLVVLAVTLAAISASTFVFGAITASQSEANSYYPNGMTASQWSNMMGNMMGGNYGAPYSSQAPVASTAQNSVLPLISFAALIGAALATGGGLFYYFAGRPKVTLSQPTINIAANTSPVNVETPYDSVSKTLTAEERQVVDVLTSHDGQYLQKYIRTETGLSRLKVHRIVNRLAERGIVTLEHSGNTNNVRLSNWLAK